MLEVWSALRSRNGMGPPVRRSHVIRPGNGQSSTLLTSTAPEPGGTVKVGFSHHASSAGLLCVGMEEVTCVPGQFDDAEEDR